MKSSSIAIVLAVAFIGSDALDACSDNVTKDLVDDPVFKQCSGMLVNYFAQHHGLAGSDIRYVSGKSTATAIGSQILAEDKKSNKCVVAVVESVPRSPPRINSVCSLPLPCPTNPGYNKC